MTGSVLKFDGFLKVYEESKEGKDEEDEELKHKLPALEPGQIPTWNRVHMPLTMDLGGSVQTNASGTEEPTGNRWPKPVGRYLQA